MSAVSDTADEVSLMGVRHSVRRKLMVIVMATTFVALLLMATAMVLYDLRTYHQAWIDDLYTQADLIGRASAPALAFDDEKVARENLSLLRGSPKIEAAAIYNAKGVLFATYNAAGRALVQFPALAASEGHHVQGDEVVLFKRIASNKEVLGTVYFRANYELVDRLQTYLAILAAVMGVCLLASLLLVSRLQAGVTRPISEITGVARRVMTQRDYSLRVRKFTNDEIGYLTDSFNAMLAEIGGRTQALERSNRQLEQEMGERRSAEAALLLVDRKKDEFLATLAHELRNPLAPLRNALEILRLSGSNPSAASSARDVMERQLRQLVHLVNDLLDVSRITTGKLVLQKERCRLSDVVQVALEAAGPAVEARRHRLDLQLPSSPVYLLADATRLAQVFVNLLNNASKFTEMGGAIVLAARVDANEAVITVTDTGVGISAEMLPRVFDMFTQADRSLERTQAGLGVGLSLARYLIELHGGKLDAASAGIGEGSVFTVRLPLLAA